MNKPKIEIKYKDNELKVLQIKGLTGEILPDHEVSKPTILNITSGAVSYCENESTQRLRENDYKLIAPNQIHHLKFETNATLELILLANTDFSFTKK